MKAPLAHFSMPAATLLGSLAAADTAIAGDSSFAKSVTPSLALGSLGFAGLRQVPPVRSVAPVVAPSAAEVRRMLAEPAPPAPECTKSCAGRMRVAVIADELLNELETVPVLGSVMVPVTQGVMIPTGEGTPPLKLAVVPTQLQRGSGVVAIGRF